jgi:hypothetical protein
MAETDYGKKPYISRADTYLEYSGEITKQYVEGLGYKYDDSYKQPYLFKDYHNMMYLYDTPETQITGQAYGGKRLTFGGDAPRVDDQYFDNSPQVASLSNFNSYARENYFIMGKPFPTLPKASVGVVERKVTTESILVSPQNMFGSAYKVLLGGTLTLTVLNYVYAASLYLWNIPNNGVYGSDFYTGSPGMFSSPSGYVVTYNAPASFTGGWTHGIVYISIELSLGSQLVQSILVRIADQAHW